jgi:hypothetical protein
VPFKPIRLLVLFDDQRGHCGRVVGRMKEMLEHRAFIVDTHRIQDGPIDIDDYKGIVVGTPAFGLGIKGCGPTDALTHYIEEDLPDLDEHKVAVFCVHELRPGMTLERMKGLVFSKGGELVAAHAYALLKPGEGEHIIPAECMVRIR